MYFMIMIEWFNKNQCKLFINALKYLSGNYVKFEDLFKILKCSQSNGRTWAVGLKIEITSIITSLYYEWELWCHRMRNRLQRMSFKRSSFRCRQKSSPCWSQRLLWCRLCFPQHHTILPTFLPKGPTSWTWSKQRLEHRSYSKIHYGWWSSCQSIDPYQSQWST